MAKNLSIPDWCEAPLPRPFVKADDLSGFHDLTPLHAASSWRPWMPLRAQEARAFCRVKRYPCAPESFEVMACSEPVFRPAHLPFSGFSAMIFLPKFLAVISAIP